MARLSKLEEIAQPAADLRGVEVYVLGVDDADQSIVYWQALEKFWNGYFLKAGAGLARYSALRDTK